MTSRLWTDSHEQRARRMRDQGLSITAIAARLGFSRFLVRSKLDPEYAKEVKEYHRERNARTTEAPE